MVEPKSPRSLRVMTVNVRKGFNRPNRRSALRELCEALRQASVDLVLLQEVGQRSWGCGRTDVHDRREEMQHCQYVADQIWPGLAHGRSGMHTTSQLGNVLLSKYPIVRAESIDISAASQKRCGIVHGAVRLPGRAGIVHAISVKLGPSHARRALQLRQLCDFVNWRIPKREPLVVAGDFNDWHGMAHAALRNCAGLGEVFVETQGLAAKTYPARFPLLRLDRIYVRSVRNFEPLNLPTWPWTGLSGHAPIAAEIQL